MDTVYRHKKHSGHKKKTGHKDNPTSNSQSKIVNSLTSHPLSLTFSLVSHVTQQRARELKMEHAFRVTRSGPKLKSPLKKSTLTLTKITRRGANLDHGSYIGHRKHTEVGEKEISGRRSKPKESSVVQTDCADVPAKLEAGAKDTVGKDNVFRKNAIKILNWLFENPQISSPPETVYGLDDDILTNMESNALSLSNFREFEKINPPEWRVEINRNQYTVRGNADGGDSFYRALAQGIYNDESLCSKLRAEICSYVTEKGLIQYQNQLREHYKRRGEDPDALYAGAKYIAKLYKMDLLRDRLPGSYFELRVASDKFHLSFVLIFKSSSHFTYINFTNKQQEQKGKKTLAFLVWPKTGSPPVWNLLTPIGAFTIPDGEYPICVKKTFVVHQCCYGKTDTDNVTTAESNHFLATCCLPQLFTFQAGSQEFALPGRNFRYPQDLYSMLSVIFFENDYHAEEIHDEILEHRRRFSYFIALSSKKKQAAGSADRFENHFRQRWGDAVDLKIAASVYKFCYTLISMDRLGNISHVSECRDLTHTHTPKEQNGNFIAFFTRVNARNLSWYKLELVSGESYPPSVEVDETKSANLVKLLEPTGVTKRINSIYGMAEQARLAFEAMYTAVNESEQTTTSIYNERV